MKRTLTFAAILGMSTCFGLAGCSDESKVTHQDTVSTPSGSTTVTTEKKIESTGDHAAGATGIAPPATSTDAGSSGAPAGTGAPATTPK